MNKQTLNKTTPYKTTFFIPLLIATLTIILALATTVLAETTEQSAESLETATIKDTVIEYTQYREIVAQEPGQGVIYKIRIINTGTREKTYELIPDTETIKNIGTYRIDPSDKITLEPEEEQTAYLYLSIEHKTSSRIEIPLTIRSGLAQETLSLTARTIGPLRQETGKTGWLLTGFKIIIAIMLVIIIIAAIIISINKQREKKLEQEYDADAEEPGFEEDIETYY